MVYMVLMTAQAVFVLTLAWDMEGWISKLALMYGSMIVGHLLTELLGEMK